MFVREKVNKSGIVSVQVIAKINGQSRLLKTIGSSRDKLVISELVRKGQEYIDSYADQQTLGFSEDHQSVRSVFESISSHTEVGTAMLLGKIFDEVGFDAIPQEIFRQLVMSRLRHPVSKLRTSDYLDKYHELVYPVQQIYRYMDKFHTSQKELVQQISYTH
jgi:hypothetical protein